MALIKSKTVSIGWVAVDFKLKGIDGEIYSLSDFFDKRGLVVVFICNHCPYAKAAWPALLKLHNRFKDKIGFAAINSNDSRQYPEDSYNEMQIFAEKNNIFFPYLHDVTQEIAEAYEAQCTPDVYLFKNYGGTFKLFYHGRINDNWQNELSVKEKSLEIALDLLISGHDAPKEQHPSMGCSIKWK